MIEATSGQMLSGLDERNNMEKAKPHVTGTADNIADYERPESVAMLAKVGSIIGRTAICEVLLTTLFVNLCGSLVVAHPFGSLVSIEAKKDQLKAAIAFLADTGKKLTDDPEMDTYIITAIDKFFSALKYRNFVAHGDLRLIEYAMSDGSKFHRLVIRPGMFGIKGNEQTFLPKWELDAEDLKKIDDLFVEWIDVLGRVNLCLTLNTSSQRPPWLQKTELPTMPTLSNSPLRQQK